MSFYFRKLPSNAPLQDQPLIQICPFHLKPSVHFSPSLLRELVWAARQRRNTAADYDPLMPLCLCFFLSVNPVVCSVIVLVEQVKYISLLVTAKVELFHVFILLSVYIELLLNVSSNPCIRFPSFVHLFYPYCLLGD